MSEQTLKPGWKRWRFDQMAINVNDRIDNPAEADVEHYVGLEHLDTDSLKIRRWGAPTDVEATKLRFRKGDIIFGRRRAYQRKLAVADFDGICSAHAMVLRPKTDVVLPEFLPFFMQSDLFMNRALEISVGSLSPTINWKTLAIQEFALPPLEEQRRIAKLLTTSLNVNDAYSSISRAGRSLLKALQLKYFFESPEGDLVTLGDVAEVKNGTTPSRSCPDYWNGTIPWLPTGKVNERFILSSDEFITEQALAKSSLSIIPAGSTLIAMIGQGQTRGRAARLEINSCINQNFGAVIPGSGVDSWYLFYQLDANYEQLRGWSHGTNQHALNCALIKSFRVRMPTLERQSEIAKELHATELAVLNAERREEKSASFLKSLREASLKTDEVS